MLLALYGLPPEYSSIRDQILASVDVPDMDIATSILHRVPAKYSTEPSGTPSPGDTAALGSLSNNQNHSRGGSSKSRAKCEHCNRFGHKIDRCWKLHGKPQVNTAQVDSPSDNIQAASKTQGSQVSYEDFLRWCQSNPNPSSTASVAHTGNSSACFSQSSSIGPWVLDSGASDHVTGNKSLFSSLCTSGFLPAITSANGSQSRSKGVGTVQILLSLSVSSVLYVSSCPFNLLSISRLTRSHDCIVTFTKSNVVVQDRISGRTIGVGHESQGLYYLSLSSTTCSATTSPLIIHSQLGHPSLHQTSCPHTPQQNGVAERKIGISLKPLGPYFSMEMFLPNFGGMLY